MSSINMRASIAMALRVKLQSDSSPKRVLLLGLGYTALALLPHLQKRGYDVWATTRDLEAQDSFQTFGIKPLFFNKKIDETFKRCLRKTDILLSSVPPKNGNDPFLSVVRQNAKDLAPMLSWVGYLSATSVYGDRGDQWVFEDEPLYPVNKRGVHRIEAELAWLETGWPVHIFRLAGLYGPSLVHPKGRVFNRHPFEKLKNGTARAVIKPGHVVNRIHIYDVVSALLCSIDRPDPTQVYNIADGNPAPPQDVLNYAADLMDYPNPPDVTVNDPGLSDMMRSFYKETKRIDISRARRTLNWSPEFKNYQQGLQHIYETYGQKRE